MHIDARMNKFILTLRSKVNENRVDGKKFFPFFAVK